MLFTRASFAALALLASQAQAGQEDFAYTTDHDASYNTAHSSTSTCESETMSSYVTTTYNTKTDYHTTTHLVEVDSYVTSIKTKVVESYVTECITTTLYYTDLITSTDTTHVTDTHSDTVTVTGTETTAVTETDSATVTNTGYITVTSTGHVTVTETNTDTTTATVPTTTYTTETIFSTTFDPCPTTCSISVETVNLYFWPTDRPYAYPTTWVDESLDYTFTYPSVYMLIPTAVGTNTAGEPFGPATSDWVLALDLSQVSTIVGDTSTGATQQLTLADIGTDCPKSVAPGAIATMAPDPRCNPVLAAPREVSSWAYPCNACGQFGLFDPPYAAPTLTGQLVEPTTTTDAAEVPTATATATASATAVLPTQTETQSETTLAPVPEPTTVVVPIETTPVPLPEPTSVSIPEGSSSTLPPVVSATESTAQPIPTAGAANIQVTVMSLVSVLLMALSL
ncbi:hypothetical protein MN608_10793 [Microdochium nivale]|nr:hypothetical protein MN608_10793 [Microdochium nivale]